MNLDWSIVWQSRGLLLEGALVTILLTALTMLIAVPGGIVLALMRGSRFKPIAWFATGFVELFRNLPLLLLVYWAFYVMPVLTGLGLPPFATGLAALCLNVSAYNSETFRSGINSIRKGQSEAGLALGMSRTEVFRQIVFPQAWPARGFRSSRTPRSSLSLPSANWRIPPCRSVLRASGCWRC
jgi:His/Glu/Gln/Arg/opine family amino acid ABC transporter permease subunit